METGRKEPGVAMRILVYPDPELRRAAEPVARVDAELRRTVRDMFVVMYESRGIGLAATQVGLPLRLFIMNVTGEPGDETVILNPQLVESDGEEINEEGCLSVPGVTGNVRRPATVVLQGYSLGGKEVEYEFQALYARVVSHELDHLDGRLIIDRMGQAARLGSRPRLRELEELYQDSLSSGS